MKKIMILLVVFGIAFALASCGEVTTTFFTTNQTSTTEAIEVNVDTNQLTLIETESYQLVVTSNDPLGLTYSFEGEGIISLSDTGYVDALQEGVALITITSRTDPSVSQVISVDVRKLITLESNRMSVDLIEGETNQLVITSNDDFAFDVTNDDIVTVSDEGLITAKSEGTTTIVVTSTYDPETSISITVNVAKLITLEVTKTDYALVVGDTETIAVTSNNGLSFQSGDTGIVTVDETGLLTAVGFGETTVRITSTYNDDVREDVAVKVYKYTEEIAISGDDLLIKGMSSQYTVAADPVGAYDSVVWESSDDSVFTVDASGLVLAVASGEATLIARSVLDDTIADSLNVSVVDILVVDQSKSTGDTFTYQTLTLDYGVQLFQTIGDALSHAGSGTIIYLADGTYAEDIVLDKEGLTITGYADMAVISGSVDVRSDFVTISGIGFRASARIFNSVPITGLTISDNDIQDITIADQDFISLDQAADVMVNNNTFARLSGGAIAESDIFGDFITIENNQISSCQKAITLVAGSVLDPALELRVFWNVIDTVDLAFTIDMAVDSVEQDLYKVARFNRVTAYQEAVLANPASEFDFTLNYWGEAGPDYLDFTNVDPAFLKGFYLDPLAMPTKSTYNPTLPIIITVTNPIEEIMIGETYQFEYEILPYELADASVRFITGAPDKVAINQSGVITPLSSGDVYIQVRSGQVSTIRTQVDFRVITTPGIEIVPSYIFSDVTVGDQFTLDTILFPYTIADQTATITSSAPEVASIDAASLVTANGEGLVTFRATLDSDPSVYVDYTIYVRGLLDPENSLMDYLTTQQISYSTIHEWTAYGFQYDYHDTRAESVSRYYFGDIPINQSKMVPVSVGIRPGEPYDPLPDDVTHYNPYNLYWIVVHDTASTALGSNALAHANYLLSNADAGVELFTSWHFTVDDHDIYQHLPEIERGYHAGDGSTLPTQNDPYLGGGNRNGIGIEMAINEDGDMYRTWQRTAKLVSYLLEKYSLPVENQKFHVDFSGKDCPRTLRNAGLVYLFEEFVAAEYNVRTQFAGATITFTSNDPTYLDNYGRIIKIPDRALTISYTITITQGTETVSRTFYTYLPGTVR